MTKKKNQLSRNSNQVSQAIRMKANAVSPETVFVLLEGDTDKKLLKGFFNLEKASLEIAYGKENLLEVLEILKDEDITLVAIKDRDFDRILEKDYSQYPNLFLTDFNDFEIMMLSSPVLQSIINEFGQEDKLKEQDVLNLLAKAAKPLGALRIINEQEELSLKFNNLSFKKFTDVNNLSVNLDDLVKTVLNKSTRHDLEIENLKGKLESILKEDFEDLDFCNGHDLIEFLSLAFTKMIGNQQQNEVKPETLESMLRVAYNFTHFKLTKLHQDIEEWSIGRNVKILINDD